MVARLRAHGALSMPADDSLQETREAYAYWRERLSSLPWHRRAARREARAMVQRTRTRLLHAKLERRGLGQVATTLTPLLRNKRTVARWLFAVLVRRNPLVRRWLVLAAVMTASLTAITVLAIVAIGALVL